MTFTDTVAGVTTYTGMTPNYYGALFEGSQITCTGNGADDMMTGVPFSIAMEIMAFDPAGASDQTLYCKQVLIGAAHDDRFCLYIEAGTGRLMGRFST